MTQEIIFRIVHDSDRSMKNKSTLIAVNIADRNKTINLILTGSCIVEHRIVSYGF